MRRMLCLAAAAGLAALPAAAQDVELHSAVSGRPLPPPYWERVRQDPGFFERAQLWPRLPSDAPGEPAAITRPVRGVLPMVVMLGTYADAPEPAVPSETVQAQLFGDNPTGNLNDFYQENSGGRLTIRGTVLPWVRSTLTQRQVVGEFFGMGSDANVGWFLREIVARSDALVDFGQYDSDGPDGVPNSGDDDGVVDLAVFQFAGPAASCGAANIWPHRAGLSQVGGAYATDDLRPDGVPVLVDGYHIQSAESCDGTPQSISIIAHETGHAFGLPDFYDLSLGLLPHERRWVVGCFSLMAAGSWGCGDGSTYSTTPTPAHLSPYEKLYLGWANVTYAQPGWRREYVLDPVQGTNQVLFVSLRPGDEYLLLEYRPNRGYDAHLPADGILAYHIEENRPLRYDCKGCRRVYRQSLVEADADDALLRNTAEGGNRGVAADMFRGRRVLDDHSTPSLRQNSGLPSNVRVEMEVVGGRARFVVTMLPVVIPSRLLAPVLGSAGAPLTTEERLALDLFGNRSGGYDLGDLRAYMRSRPNSVVPTS